MPVGLDNVEVTLIKAVGGHTGSEATGACVQREEGGSRVAVLPRRGSVGNLEGSSAEGRCLRGAEMRLWPCAGGGLPTEVGGGGVCHGRLERAGSQGESRL